MDIRTVEHELHQSYHVLLVASMNDVGVSRLAEVLRGRKTLLVSTPTVSELYAKALVRRLTAVDLDVSCLVLDCVEKTKSLDQVTRICREAYERELDRSSVLLGMGGGVCMDLVTVAASWIRRGIRYGRIPTTLVGQIDGGIGVKGAVNFHGRKNALGCYKVPTVVLIDSAYLRSLPVEQIGDGLSEIIKMALVSDTRLFELVEHHARTLLVSRFLRPADEAKEIIWRSIEAMLVELEVNLFEDRTYQRLVDFGHTFSPKIESLSGYELSHGRAVAIDMALSTVLANLSGYLDASSCDRILDCLEASGLPIYSPLLTPTVCHDAVQEAKRHRGGHLNLVVPEGIGEARFVTDERSAPIRLVTEALEILEQRHLKLNRSNDTSVRNRVRRAPSSNQEPATSERSTVVFDVGGTSLRAGILDGPNGRLSSVSTTETPSFQKHPCDGPAEIGSRLVRQMQRMVEDLAAGDVEQVAVAFAGPVSPSGQVLAAPTVWGASEPDEVDLQGLLRASWPGAKIHLLNDVTAAGYRYLRHPRDSLCIVTVGSGIGNKVFVDGRPVVGLANRGGEIGHILVDPSEDALMCDCGGRGHLGAISSGRGTLRLAQAKAQDDSARFRRSSLSSVLDAKGHFDNRDLVSAFCAGDGWTVELVAEAARPLARVLASIHLSIGIERFVIYGGFATALGEQYRRILVREAEGSSWSVGQDWDGMIEIGEDDDLSGLVGGGRYLSSLKTG